MGRKLTLDEKIKRATKMKNKKTIEDLPLLEPVLEQSGFLTNEDEQRDRYEKMAGSMETFWARLEKRDMEAGKVAEERRSIIAKRISPEQLHDLDIEVAKPWRARSAIFVADYWWQVLKQFAPDIAQAHCHVKEMHGINARWHEFCPGCGLKLEPIENKPEQMSLF